MDDNATGSAEGHMATSTSAATHQPRAERPSNTQRAMGSSRCPPRRFVAVGSDGPGGLPGNDADAEATGAGPHAGFAAVMQQLHQVAEGQDAVQLASPTSRNCMHKSMRKYSSRSNPSLASNTPTQATSPGGGHSPEVSCCWGASRKREPIPTHRTNRPRSWPPPARL